ncbi:MAG: VOC family protein [Actinobacteria bacterium]|nr:VOC family protein [Actinomycetota bacterium]
MPIDAVPDHVAVAVPDFDVADARWRDELGGRWVAWYHARGLFRSRQLRFRGGGKLELLMPSEADPSPDTFVRRYLDRFGAQVHHLTLKVPDLPAAIGVLEAEGLDVVDVDLSGDTWKESFLRPSQVGGLIVQVAWSGQTDAQWAAAHDFRPEEPPSDGAVLRGPLLEHPDLDHAAWLWTLLGAQVEPDGGELVAHWDGAPLEVRVRQAPTAGPVGLRFDGVRPLPRDAELGAAVVAS